ncbi:MAG: hypothetical protein B7Y90_05390, partial [Alphaproteobacteria bacterium 32-64-14]
GLRREFATNSGAKALLLWELRQSFPTDWGEGFRMFRPLCGQPPPSRDEDVAIHLPRLCRWRTVLPRRRRGRWIDAKHQDGGG